MIQKENLDDQEKIIKINDLKLRGTACSGEISSRNFHDQIWIEKFLTILRRRDAIKKCPWSNKNWKILDKKIGWISKNCEVVCLFGCWISLTKGRTSQLRGTACGGEMPARPSKLPWSNKNWKILTNKICWMLENFGMFCSDCNCNSLMGGHR